MKAAIYCRLSREDDIKECESESIQNQRAMLIQYAENEGWEIFDIYCDEDYSGIDRDRPEFNRMIADAQQRHFDIVLVKTQSRFTRDMELVEKYIHGKFAEWNIRFVAAVDHADTAMKGNKKARQINGLINEWYLEDLSENIRAVLDHKRKNGQYIGSFALYGYQKDPVNKNKLIVDPIAAAVIRKIYAMYLAGSGTQSIAHELNCAQIPNPTTHKKMLCETYRNGFAQPDSSLWNRTTISRILTNQIYTGDMVQGKRKKVNYKSEKIVAVPKEKWIIVPDTHEAIIEREEFDQVQQMMSRRTRAGRSGTVHPFAGIVYCAECGSVMQKCTSGNYSYLRCKKHAMDASKCTNHNVRLDVLVNMIKGKIQEYIKQYADFSAINTLDTMEAAADISEDQQDKVRQKLKECERVLSVLYCDRATGVIDESDFTQLYHSYKEKKNMLLDELETAQHLRTGVAEKDCKAESIQHIFDTIELTHEMCTLFIRKIYIGKHMENARQEIMIEWQF